MGVQEIDLGDDKDLDLSKDDSNSLDLTNREETSQELPVSNQGKEKVWSTEELKVVKLPILAYIPQHIVLMMRSIEAKMGYSRLEFGAFLKGEIDTDGCLMVSEDFLVLKQQVTGASIDFQEDPPTDYNGIIHRHPSGCKRFSGTDDHSINQNYDFSLLYVDNHITYGIINLVLKNDVRVQTELSVRVVYPLAPEIGNVMENITEAPKPIPPQKLLSGRSDYRQSSFFPGWGDEVGNHWPDDETDQSGSSTSDLVEVWDLGSGYTYDGTYIYDAEDEIIEEEELPEECTQAYLNAINGDIDDSDDSLEEYLC